MFASPSPGFTTETEILVEQQPPQGVFVCDHAGLAMNKLSFTLFHQDLDACGVAGSKLRPFAAVRCAGRQQVCVCERKKKSAKEGGRKGCMYTYIYIYLHIYV